MFQGEESSDEEGQKKRESFKRNPHIIKVINFLRRSISDGNKLVYITSPNLEVKKKYDAPQSPRNKSVIGDFVQQSTFLYLGGAEKLANMYCEEG